MTWLFYANLEEIRKYFQQQRIDANNVSKQEIKRQRSLDDVVGLLAYDYKNDALAFIPLKNLLRGKEEYKLVRLEGEIYEPHDISIIPDRRLLVLGNSPYCHISIYNNKGELIKEFEEENYVNRIFYDGRKHLYHAGKHGIKRIDLDTLVEEVIVPEDKMKDVIGRAIEWLQFKDRRWYVLVWNSDETHTLYSTLDLKNVSNWKREIHWDTRNFNTNSFDFLPDGSIISTVPLEYLDINGKERIKVRKLDVIYRLGVSPLGEREAYVFYTGLSGLSSIIRETTVCVGYALLKKEYRGWEVIKSKYIKSLKRPIELVTREGYEKVVKPLIELG